MATYYWVGGSGNWNATSTTNWATSSGGTGGAGVPTSADDVIFDANSNVGTGAFTVTVTGTSAAPAVCNDFSTGGAGGALDGVMTLNLAADTVLHIYGNLTLPATNLSVSGTGNVAQTDGFHFKSTTTGKTITTNGVSFGNHPVRFSGIGGEWTLGSAFGTIYNVYFERGTLKTANFNMTSANYISAGAFTLELGSSSITATQATPITFTSAGFSLNAGTSTINCSNASPAFNGGGLTYYNVSFTSTSQGAVILNGTNTFNNLTFTSITATGRKGVVIGANQTINGTLTLGAANTAIRRVQLFSDVVGTARTITVNGTLSTLADIDFRDITAGGTVATPWAGTRLGNGGNVTNITTDTPKTVYWNLAAGGDWTATAWATSSGGTPNVNNFPLTQDTAIIENTGLNTGATISSGTTWNFGTVDASTRTLAMTLGIAGTYHGNLSLSSAVIAGTGVTAVNFSGASTQTFTSAGVTYNQPLVINKPVGTSLLLGDALTTSAGFTLTQGTLDLNGYDLSCGVFSSDNSNTRSINFGAKRIYVADTRESGGQIIAMTTMTNFNYTGSGIFNVNNSGSGTKRCSVGTTAGGTESNAISIECAAGTGILKTFGHFKDINLTGYSGQYDLQEIGGTLNKFVYGDMTISSTTTVLGGSTNNLTFQKSSGTQTLVSAGKTFDCPVVKSAAGTLTLGDNTTVGSTRTFTLTQGTLNLDGKTLSTGLFSSSNSNARTINLGNKGKITITGSGSTAWNAATATNLTATGTGTIDMVSSSAKTFVGGNAAYPYTINQGGVGDLTITGNNTIYGLTNSVRPTTIKFEANKTHTFNTFNLNGYPDQYVYLRSTSPGTKYNLVVPIP